jgi:hypothetical protein
MPRASQAETDRGSMSARLPESVAPLFNPQGKERGPHA